MRMIRIRVWSRVRNGLVVVGVRGVAIGFLADVYQCAGNPMLPLWFPSIDTLSILVSLPT